MQTLLITPKNPSELALLQTYLQKEHIASKILSDDDKEDIGMMMLMSEVDTNDTVSEDEVKKILSNS